MHWAPGGLLCWPFWGDGPGVGLAFCCFCDLPCVVLFLCFSILFALRLPRFGRGWGEVWTGLGAFRAFFRFVLAWFCRFPLLLVWEGLRFVIVALPGLFNYLFCHAAVFRGTCLAL